MRAIVGLCCVAIAVVVASVSTSRGDGDTENGSPADAPVMPFKGAKTPMKDPFAPYGTGEESEPGSTWKYEDLSADEKAIADRGLDEDQTAVQDAYAAAARGMAQRAKAEGAAVMLGIDVPLEDIGLPTEEEAAP